MEYSHAQINQTGKMTRMNEFDIEPDMDNYESGDPEEGNYDERIEGREEDGQLVRVEDMAKEVGTRTDIETPIEDHESAEQLIARADGWFDLWCSSDQNQTEMAAYQRVRRLFGAEDDNECIANEAIEYKYNSIVYNYSSLIKRLADYGLADTASTDASARTRFGQMLKVSENIWHGFHVLMFLGRVRLVNNTRSQALLPDHLLSVRYCPPDFSGINKYQQLLLFYLSKAREKNYRKIASTIYEPVYSNEGKFRHAWRPKMQIDQFVYEALRPREHNMEMWKCLTDRGHNASNASKYLEHAHESDFPFLHKNKKLRGFTNGVYDIGNDLFYELGDPRLRPDMVCGHYFEEPFENDLYEEILRTCSCPKCPAFQRRKRLIDDALKSTSISIITASILNDIEKNIKELNESKEELTHAGDLSDACAMDISDKEEKKEKEKEKRSIAQLHNNNINEEVNNATSSIDKMTINNKKEKETETETKEETKEESKEEEKKEEENADDNDCICKDDYMKLPTPAVQSILDYQELDEEVCRWIYAMTGRLFFDIKEKDKWEAHVFYKGVGGTGKSSILRLIEYMFDKNDVGIIPNTGEKAYPLMPLLEKHIGIGMDIFQNFSLDQYVWQSCVSGEGVTAARKYLPPLTLAAWIIQFVMAGNSLPGWTDNGGSVSRRLLVVRFLKMVKNGDPKLFGKMKKEIAIFIKKCTCAYLCMVERYGNVDIWTVLPPAFSESKNELQSQTNPLEAFINSDLLLTNPAIKIPLALFRDRYRQFCHDEQKVSPAWTLDFIGLCFQKHGLTIEGGKHEYHGDCLDEKFIIGCDLKTNQQPVSE